MVNLQEAVRLCASSYFGVGWVSLFQRSCEDSFVECHLVTPPLVLVTSPTFFNFFEVCENSPARYEPKGWQGSCD